jgi:uncharacterized alkaline shock family protein YloU
MKKILHGFTGLLIVLLPLVWGGLIIYGNGFNTSMRDRVFGFVQESPLSGTAVGLLLLLVGLVYLGTYGSSRPRLRTISFDSEDGAVSISVNAVCDFIRKLGDEFGAVISLEPKIRSEKDLISIDLDVKIQTGSRIPELSQQLQNRVRESIRDGLGIVEVREIKVHIREIVGAPPPSQTA